MMIPTNIVNVNLLSIFEFKYQLEILFLKLNYNNFLNEKYYYYFFCFICLNLKNNNNLITYNNRIIIRYKLV